VTVKIASRCIIFSVATGTDGTATAVSDL